MRSRTEKEFAVKQPDDGAYGIALIIALICAAIVVAAFFWW